jgi:Phosphodiester glycosidase
MPALKQFAFPTRPLAIVVLLAAGVGAGLVLARPFGSGTATSGVTVMRSSVATAGGRAPLVRIEVSLADPRYRVVPLVAGRPVSGLTAVAAMNADFSNVTTGVPSGRLVIGGRTLVVGDPREPSLGLAPGHAVFGTGLTGFADVVSGKPQLVADGRPVGALWRDGVTSFQLTTRAPRVAVAVIGRKLEFIGVGMPGMTMREFQRLLVGLHVDQALGFDGGPSADIAFAGRPLLGQPEVAPPVAVAIVRAP